MPSIMVEFRLTGYLANVACAPYIPYRMFVLDTSNAIEVEAIVRNKFDIPPVLCLQMTVLSSDGDLVACQLRVYSGSFFLV